MSKSDLFFETLSPIFKYQKLPNILNIIKKKATHRPNQENWYQKQKLIEGDE